MTGTPAPATGGDIVFGALTPTVRTAVRRSGGWFVSNAGWIIGQRATLVIDTFASERRTVELLDSVHATRRAAAASATGLLVVLTHAHGDHANGAGLLEAAGATIYAAVNTGEELLKYGIQRFPGLLATPDWGAVIPPSTFTPLADTQIFDLGGTTAEIATLSDPAHSAGDVFVHLPQQRILFAGDLVWNGVTPLALNGSVTGWLDQMDSLASRQPLTVVPGHGAVGGPDLIDSTRRYLDWIVTLAEEMIDGAELTPDSLMDRRADLEWGAWACPERDIANVSRAVSDVDGRPYDAMQAMTAMRDRWDGLIKLEA